MSNKEIVYEFIQKNMQIKNGQMQGLETAYIAHNLGIKRPNVSALLNQLVKEGKLTKVVSRPVKYLLQDKVDNDAFSKLVGYDKSLKSAIKQAKAAILYPAGALRFSIYAPSGSGSSEFIKATIKFAQMHKVIPQNCPIIEINCRNYAGDSEYLDDKLFENGKLQQNCFQVAAGKVLIVNHYEYLNNQQLSRLAQIIDDLPNEHHGIVIFTGKRQISRKLDFSIEITLPAFNQRYYTERLQIIEKFFTDEAKKSSKKIVVSLDIIKALILTQYVNNLKELKKLIIRACANAYIRAVKNTDNNRIYLNINDFPAQVSLSLIKERSINADFERILNQRQKYIFSSNDKILKKSHSDQSIYNQLADEYYELEKNGLDDAAVKDAINAKIGQLFTQYRYTKTADKTQNLAELSKIVPIPIIKMVQKWLTQTSTLLKRQFDASIFYGLCLHLNSVINLHVKNQQLSLTRIKKLFTQNPVEYEATKKLVLEIKNNFNFDLNNSEVAIIMMFLADTKLNTARPVLLYALHGDGAAQKLSEVTNALNKTNNAYGYDMNLDKDSEIVYQELEELLKKIDQGKGIIVIYDMGSFKAMFTNLAKKTAIAIRLIQMPITLVGLEVSRKNLTEENLDNVYHNVASNLRNLTSANDTAKRNMIITLCHTGEGGAVSIKDYIEQYSHLDVQVKAMNISDREKLANKVEILRQAYNIMAFVGTYNPNLYGIPFISIKDIFENSKENLDKVLNFIPITDNSYLFDRVYAQFSKVLVYTPINKVKEFLPRVIDSLTDTYQLDEDQRIGLFTHIVILIENILSGRKREVKVSAQQLKNVNTDYNIVLQQMRILEKAFNVVFTNDDIYTVIKIVKKIF